MSFIMKGFTHVATTARAPGNFNLLEVTLAQFWITGAPAGRRGIRFNHLAPYDRQLAEAHLGGLCWVGSFTGRNSLTGTRVRFRSSHLTDKMELKSSRGIFRCISSNEMRPFDD
jgi:hypothetical protein